MLVSTTPAQGAQGPSVGAIPTGSGAFTMTHATYTPNANRPSCANP